MYAECRLTHSSVFPAASTHSYSSRSSAAWLFFSAYIWKVTGFTANVFNFFKMSYMLDAGLI